MVGKRDVVGTRLTRCIKERGMPELSCVICKPLASALGVHITTHMQDAELVRQRLHMRCIRIRVGTKVVIHMHRDDTAARGSPAGDRCARGKEHARVHPSRAPHRDCAARRPPAAADQLLRDLSGQRMTADAACERWHGSAHPQMLWNEALRTRMRLAECAALHHEVLALRPPRRVRGARCAPRSAPRCGTPTSLPSMMRHGAQASRPRGSRATRGRSRRHRRRSPRQVQAHG